MKNAFDGLINIQDTAKEKCQGAWRNINKNSQNINEKKKVKKTEYSKTGIITKILIYT